MVPRRKSKKNRSYAVLGYIKGSCSQTRLDFFFGAFPDHAFVLFFFCLRHWCWWQSLARHDRLGLKAPETRASLAPTTQRHCYPMAGSLLQLAKTATTLWRARKFTIQQPEPGHPPGASLNHALSTPRPCWLTGECSSREAGYTPALIFRARKFTIRRVGPGRRRAALTSLAGLTQQHCCLTEKYLWQEVYRAVIPGPDTRH
jgi:hypothetical protein